MLGLKTTHIGFLSRYVIWIVDSLLSVFSTYFCFLFFHYLLELEIATRQSLQLLLLAIVVSFLLTWMCQTYRGIIRHATLAELMRIVYAMLLKAGFWLCVAYGTQEYVGLFIYSQVIADFICSVFLLMFSRTLIVSFYYNLLRKIGNTAPNTLVYGTSEAAISLANYLRNDKENAYHVIGFITRDKQMKGSRILGCSVYYIRKQEELSHLLETNHIKYILFTNNADLHADEDLLSYSIEKQITLRIAPLMEGEDGLSKRIQLREVQIEDLLGRDEIKINLSNIRKELSTRTIMVTGAAGSIGSELCRQLCKFNPKQLILFDFSETATYQIDMELRKKFPNNRILSVIGDVRNKQRVESQVKQYRPDIIFHAAAYKHVPLMEEYPCEAVRANVLGTQNVADVAVDCGVEKFIMISTDKAVHPSSVMGATKHIAEMYVQSLGNKIKSGGLKGKTCFITTRFGNVLGSNGSVIPLFRQQILEGGPVTVTHPDIIRYFMTIPEACRLVLEAAFLGTGNDIFIFDMGKPVKIADLARQMIRLSGLHPDEDIKIEYTGLRPGEKLYEELLYKKEDTTSTDNSKIFRAKSIEVDYDKMKERIGKLIEIACTDNKEETVRMMKTIAPDYVSQHSVYEKLDTI